MIVFLKIAFETATRPFHRFVSSLACFFFHPLVPYFFPLASICLLLRACACAREVVLFFFIFLSLLLCVCVCV